MNNARLHYVCRSRFAESTIAQALAWPEPPLIGVSLYGHGCFFQCVEGDSALVDDLVLRLAQLPQGFDAHIIAWHPITQRSLSHSATHYLLEGVPSHTVLQQHGMPLAEAILLEDVITLFQATHPIPQHSALEQTSSL
ncbi:MAG: hypothetical protein WA154_03810 [Moraxellaceae bacterium]